MGGGRSRLTPLLHPVEPPPLPPVLPSALPPIVSPDRSPSVESHQGLHERPACGSCVASESFCTWFTKPEESRANALKRKHDELQQQVESDATVLEMLRRSRPEDTLQLVRLIRQCQDSHSIVEDVQNGTLLLQLFGAAPVETPGNYDNDDAFPDDSTDASESDYTY
ncbi:unnamed protein product [Clonostachys rosea]|uniref:Uncharacterized protein n=1 Tax=Bionectria ochroleuca TaxID=29856 RepID=A0ABY6U8V8_BIOOC|nr:unnamed protein product [Clonostachys rosea]